MDTEAGETQEALYKKREQIYPKLVHGKYRLTKWLVLFATLGVYYLLPWVRWERGPHEPNQAVLVDFEGHRFYFFFIEIWPDQLYFLTGLLIASALLLFLTTAVFGRLWCGYACPQTVWTDLFIAVERMIEGDRNDRLRLDKKKWGAEKILKKGTKHAIWLYISAATGGAWVLYFHDAPTVMRDLFTGQAPGSAYLFLAILTFTTYSLAGIMREQVCTYMCPWPRIQAAMTDNDTFTVGYYAARGEPRGKHKKGTSWDGRGDCIDCMGCVVACPMGIDIRDGDQLECINCGLCIDACDDVMKKVGRPTGLIAYGSDYRDTEKTAPRQRLPRFLRPRTIVYASALSIVSLIVLVGLGTTQKIEFSVERDRAPTFTRLSDGSIRNAITAKVLNKNSTPHTFSMQFNGPGALKLGAVGHTINDNILTFDVPGDTQVQKRIFLTLPAEVASKDLGDIHILLVDQDGDESISREIPFLSGDRL